MRYACHSWTPLEHACNRVKLEGGESKDYARGTVPSVICAWDRMHFTRSLSPHVISLVISCYSVPASTSTQCDPVLVLAGCGGPAVVLWFLRDSAGGGSRRPLESRDIQRGMLRYSRDSQYMLY